MAMRAVLAILCALSLHAQIVPMLRALPDGDELTIRNNSTIPLAAYVIYANKVDPLGHERFVLYSDPLIELGAKPLAPGEERTDLKHALGHAVPNLPGIHLHFLQEPIAVGGILADGRLTGDTGLATRLILRRSNMLLAIDTAIEMLTNASRRNIPREQLISQFQTLLDGMNRSYLFPEQQVGQHLYQSIVDRLKDLPEPALGSPFPPSSFVEGQTVPLRRQRSALLESEPSLPVAALAGK